MEERMRIAIGCSVLLFIACGGSNPPAAPLARIPMPDGSKLHPYDPGNPGAAHPYGMALSGSKLYVALGNRHDDKNLTIAGPGFLAGVVPSQGVTDLIDLGGGVDDKQCQSAGVVRADGTHVYVTCSGNVDGSGQALVEVDPAGAKVARSLGLAHSPSGVAFTSTTIWVGVNDGPNVLAIDRTSFQVSNTATATVPCAAGSYSYVPDVAVIGGDLYALCATDLGGTISRLDAATGQVKGQFGIGASPTELAATSDGRIAIVCSLDNTLWMATPGAGGAITAALAHNYASGTATLQDVRSFGKYVYTTASLSNTVQKIDVSVNPVQVVAEVATAANSFPWSIVPLDENTAIVSDSGTTEDLVTVNFAAK
jgi:DNA-binding beta-propeller fold protein YncE